MSTQFEVTITPVNEVFYNVKTNWAVYECTFEDEDRTKVNRGINDGWDTTIKVIGVLPRLQIGAKHAAMVEEEYNEKFGGYQYRAHKIFQELPSTPEEQEMFLQTILPPSHAEALISTYKNEDILKLIEEDKVDLNKLRGIGEKTYEQIKDKIKKNVSLHRALIDLAEYDLTYNAIKSLVEFYGSAELLVEKVKKNPYILVEVDGFGFKRVDEIALNSGVKKDSSYRLEAAIKYVLSEAANSEGHTWITLKSLMSRASGLTGQPQKMLLTYIKDNQSKMDLYLDKNKVGLNRYYEREKTIYENMMRLLNSPSHVRVNSIEEKIQRAEEAQGFTYTDEQRKAILDFSEHNILIIDGKAGTGKSTSLRGICSVFGGYQISMCALSGKAALRMAETSGLEASTIHRLLEFNPDGGFARNRENQLTSDIIIIDEMSMVDANLFYRLSEAIMSGAKLLLLGDLQQLPPVGVGQVFRDLTESGKIPIVSLTKVMRQAEKSGILVQANGVREGKQFLRNDSFEGVLRFGELKDFIFIGREDGADVYDGVVDLCGKYKGDIMDLQVIVPQKTRGSLSTKKLNEELQDIFNPEDPDILAKNPELLDPYNNGQRTDVIVRGDTTFRIGDKVLHNGNNYQKEVYNGSFGIIKNIKVMGQDRMMTVDFGDMIGEVTFTTSKELAALDLGYACTVHKYQGSQCRNIIFAIDFSAYRLLSRQLTYTAMTRAEKKLFFIGQTKAVRFSIRKSMDDVRNTHLKDFFSV